MEKISFVCGLGNPGARYRFTRHNLGFRVLDELSRRNSLAWRRACGPSQQATLRIAGRKIVLLKPLGYMNNSGRAISRVQDLEPSNILVLCDDIHLPLGKMRLRESGGSGGHKGLQSIIEELGTESFARLRMGVGPPPASDWAEFVLHEFDEEERPVAESLIESAADAVELILKKGIQAAMDRYNRSD